MSAKFSDPIFINCSNYNDFSKSDITVSAISNLFFHVMFIRGLIPTPYDSLLQNENKKLSKLLDSTERVFFSLKNLVGDLFANYNETNVSDKKFRFSIHVSIGPSINNPKELYCLHFDIKDSFISSDGESTQLNRFLLKLKRSFIHKLIEHSFNTDHRYPPSQSNIFISMLVPPLINNTNITLSNDSLSEFVFRENFDFLNIINRIIKRKHSPKPIHIFFGENIQELNNDQVNNEIISKEDTISEHDNYEVVSRVNEHIDEYINNLYSEKYINHISFIQRKGIKGLKLKSV